MIYIIHHTYFQEGVLSFIQGIEKPIKQNITLSWVHINKQVFPLQSDPRVSMSVQASQPSKQDSSSKPPSNTRLKNQIDAILQNDLSVLARHPDTPHRALLTTHNNPLIMRYVKNVYNEYSIQDPLPKRYAKYSSTFEEKDVPEEPQTLKKKEHKKNKNVEETTKKKKIAISKNLRESWKEVKEIKLEKEEKRMEFDTFAKEYDQTEKKEEKYNVFEQRLKTEYKNRDENSRERMVANRYSLSPQPNLITLNNHHHLHSKLPQPPSTPPRRALNFSYHTPSGRVQKTLPTNYTQEQLEGKYQIASERSFKGDIKQSLAVKASNCYFDHPLRINQVDSTINKQRQRPAISFVISRQPRIEMKHQQTPIPSDQRHEYLYSPVTPQKIQQPLPPQQSSASSRFRSTTQPKSIIDRSSIRLEENRKQRDVNGRHNINVGENRTLGVRRVEQQGERKIKFHWEGLDKPLPHIVTFKSPINNGDSPLVLPIPESPQFSHPQSPLDQPIKKEKGEYIPESFKYCIGCQQALLVANIPFHEQKCDDFKYLATLPANELIGYLKSKITKFEDNIQHYSSELLQKDCEDISLHSSKMLQESRTILQEGHLNEKYSEEYEEALAVSRKWMRMSEEISKVNWFLKVREGIRKKMNI